MKKSIFLYLKQGIKGIMKVKIQFIVIIILTFLATFILSATLSSTKRISDDYNNTMSKMESFNYVNQKVVDINSSDDMTTDIIAPMDIMNSQFIYSIDSNDLSSLNNRALEINYNLSFFPESNLSNYNQETFLTKTFKDPKVQEAFLLMILDSEYWFSIFEYNYDPIKDLILWDPYSDINFLSDATSSSYLKNSVANQNKKVISTFYTYTIETLKQNYLEDLFLDNEKTPNYIKNTLFYELKNKGFITRENFKMNMAKYEYDQNNENIINISDNGDNDIYNRYLYFSLESYLRQIIRATTEYPAYWINQAIIESNKSERKEREDVVKSFNELNKDNKIGFNFIEKENIEPGPNGKPKLTQNLKSFGVTIFTWIFGFNPEVEEFGDIETKKEFIVNKNNTPWNNSIDFSLKYSDNEYLKTKNEVYEKGMRGSLTQLVVTKKNNKVINVDKTFSTNYLKHVEFTSIEKELGDSSNFDDLDYYENYTYDQINRIKGYFIKKELLAKITSFDYKVRAEIEYTDNISEITYRIVDVENQWKDLITLYEGNLPRTTSEILINTQFAKANKYKIGENIKIGGSDFVISGFASDPLTYYPIANITNPLPNSKKNAIVYANQNNLAKIVTSNLNKSTTKTVYSFLTYENQWDIQNMENDLNKFKAYSFSNTIEVYNSYSFLSGKTKFNDINIIDNYKVFSSSNLKLNWLIAPQIIYGFKIFSIIFCIVICLIVISATVIAIKKTVELNSGEIGILKAMGARTSDISWSYLSYGIIVTLFVIPFAWIMGSIVQEVIAKVFIEFVGGRSSIVFFSPIAIVISILIFGILLCVVSFLTAFILIKKPTLEIINKLEKNKKNNWLNQLKNSAVKNRSFSTRFSLELAVSGFSKTILSATTVYVAGFLVSFGLTIPGLVQNIVGSYYKNVLYSNYYENRELIGNAPLAKTSLSPTKKLENMKKT
ncbi:ABC transporter permease [Spiroplasma floricola]|uniref:ABC transporter permease n=1 Tax=Spiroplasma floricola TaxID=216937 RepID=UPI000C2D1445|nr:ABC transporter permease [Spiroplasma floricola]